MAKFQRCNLKKSINSIINAKVLSSCNELFFFYFLAF